jgi:hypothetical protein
MSSHLSNITADTPRRLVRVSPLLVTVAVMLAVVLAVALAVLKH